MSNCDVFFYPTCSMFYFVFSIYSFDVSSCFITSYPSAICSFIPCNMFSDCSVHFLTWRVISTRRTKCTIPIYTTSAVMIHYASPPNHHNIRQFQLETMSRWTHELMNNLNNPFPVVLISHRRSLWLVDGKKRIHINTFHLDMTSNRILQDGIEQ